MRVERISLNVLGGDDIEAESRADERAAGFWIGIGGEHPAFVLMVAKDAHQRFDVELDFRRIEIEERRWLRWISVDRRGRGLRYVWGWQSGGVAGPAAVCANVTKGMRSAAIQTTC